MTNTRAGRGEEPLLSGLAVDGDVVSIDYEDQDPEFTQSDTPRSHEMPTELRGDTVENSSDRLDSPRSGKSPAAADAPKKAKQLAPIRIKTKTYKTAVAGKDGSDDDAEKAKPDQTKSLLEKISSQRVQLHNLHDENAVLRGRLESLEERVDHYKGENRELKAILSDNEHELSRAKATVSELQDKEEAILGKRKREVDPKLCGRPQTFDGKVPNVRDWLMNLELYFDLMADRIPDYCQVGTAATYLKGEALRYWHFRLKQLEEHEKQDIQVFQRSMIERFDSANDPIAARYKLDKLQQGDNAMRVHVQNFDTLCSYIPDMADGEKIHRFLTTARPECAKVICNDPSTGARWARYTDMRRYALNQYAHEKNTAVSHAEHITAIGDLLGGRTSRKRSTHQYHLTRRSLGREPSRSRSRERGAGGSGGSGEGEGHAGGSSSDKPYTYTDKNGKKVHRSREIKNFCFEKGLCGICYAHGHTANTCTIRNVKQGLPPGMNR